ELVYIPISDTSSRMIALETDTVDVAIDVPPYEIERLEGEGLKIVSELTTRNMFFYYNLVNGPCTDVRVRRALNYAIDREEICETLFGGMAKPCNGVLNALVFGTDDVWREDFFDYNPDKAKELLAEAGYAEGEIKLKLVGPDGRYMFDRDTVTLIAGYFNEIGVETEVEVTEWGSYWNMFIEGARAVFNGEQESFDWDLAYLGISADNLDADHEMQTLWTTGQICCNMNNFSDPRMDEYRIEGLQELDPDKRLATYKEATDLVLELCPQLWLFHMPYVFGTQPNIEGCEGDPIGKYHFWRAYEIS
ncbi:MAG: ABC transporter substrate-binding protein, partial [Candidatus Bathyarchaeota archaeon]|nr:ABC transporter substrate-binding protein [Candidatus Bathyarchaeota archaeon]